MKCIEIIKVNKSNGKETLLCLTKEKINKIKEKTTINPITEWYETESVIYLLDEESKDTYYIAKTLNNRLSKRR